MYYWSRDIIFVLCGWDYYTIILIKSWDKFQGLKCNLSHQLFLAFSSFLSTICFLYFFSFETWPSVSFVLAWTTPSSVFVSCFFFFLFLPSDHVKQQATASPSSFSPSAQLSCLLLPLLLVGLPELTGAVADVGWSRPRRQFEACTLGFKTPKVIPFNFFISSFNLLGFCFRLV